jgi:uncharacterized membrane protein YdbT with pleckstrin-like domain
MSYVQRVLQPGEVVRHTASIHWIVYWPGTVLLLLALVSYGYAIIGTGQGHDFLWWVAAILAAIGLFLLVPEWFTWWTTEIAVTNLRVIYKTGFIRRTTNEMNMDKVESVRVDQSILGRILDYGDVTIIGTGEGEEELLTVARPLDLRNHITAVEGSKR